MNIKKVILECEECGEDITNQTLCLGVPNNEFYVDEVETDFTCNYCDASYFVHVNTERL